MEWYHVLGIVLGNLAFMIPLFLWNRAESRADIRHMDNRLESNRLENNLLIKEIREDIKDFHGRLCSIEERRIKNKEN